MKFYSLLFLALVAQVVLSCFPKQNKDSADLVFTNGRIWLGKDSASFAEAVAIKGNRILQVGSTEEIKKLVNEKSKVINLEGRLMIPGFNDAHIHFLGGSIGLTEVDLNNCNSIQELVGRIKKFALENPDKKWITGRGWQYTMFEGGLPAKEILDSALSDRPVFVRAYDGHSAWANTAALKLAMITKATKYTDFGEMVRNSKGEPTGAFKEGAMSLIDVSIPELTRGEKMSALRKGIQLAASLGITSIGNASGSVDELKMYEELLKRNELTLRVAAAFSVGEKTTPEEIKRYTALKDSVGKNDRLTIRNVKFMLDGVIESHTAGMLEPYSNLSPKETLTTGSLTMPVEKYRSLVAEFDKIGFQVYTHAIGDRAVREALNAYELASKTNATSNRNRIEHIETISPDDLPRFASLGVMPSMEPIHAEPGTVSVWADGVGKKRLPYSFAWNSMLKAGGHLVYSSDWPACVSINPIRGLHTAVTRRTIEGEPKEGWVPEQKISITQALTAYTQGGAFSSMEENSKGKIAPGYLADVIVLSQDLFTIDPMKTHETKVLMTVFDGKVIYEVSDSGNR
jgi:hypothetical protein